MKKIIAIVFAFILLGLAHPTPAVAFLFWKHKKNAKHKKVAKKPNYRKDNQTREDKEYLRDTGHTDFSTLTRKQQRRITRHHMYPMKKEDMAKFMVKSAPKVQSKPKGNKPDATAAPSPVPDAIPAPPENK